MKRWVAGCVGSLLSCAILLAISASPAQAARIGFDYEGVQLGGTGGGQFLFEVRMRIEPTELVDDWAWSLQCTTGCTIVEFTYDYLLLPDGPPPEPGNPDAFVDWQGNFQVLTLATSDYSIDANGALAGSIGSSASTSFAGNGTEVLIGWALVETTTAYLPQDYDVPWEYLAEFSATFAPGEGISGDNGAVPTTFGSAYMYPADYLLVPEPGTAPLLGFGLLYLGLGRRSRREAMATNPRAPQPGRDGCRESPGRRDRTSPA